MRQFMANRNGRSARTPPETNANNKPRPCWVSPLFTPANPGPAAAELQIGMGGVQNAQRGSPPAPPRPSHACLFTSAARACFCRAHLPHQHALGDIPDVAG